MKLLAGKTAIMTGCAGGIGAACVEAAAQNGAKYILIADIDLDSAVKNAQEISKKYQTVCEAIKADVTSEQDVLKVFEYFKTKQDKLDILLNNAGICRAVHMYDMQMDQWDRTMEINLKGAFLFAREAVKMMIPHRCGRIINMSSQAGKSGGISADMAYSSSKGGLLTLTRSVAKQVAADQITVNSLAPGLIKTAMTDATFVYDPETVPLKRIGTPQEVADCFLFLASDLSRYVTGACLDVNGGIRMD